MNKYERYYNECLENIEDSLGSGETFANTLNLTCKQLLGDKFVGIFPSDKIPKLKGKTYCIANTDPSNKPGTHWVALAGGRGKTYVYDSFGRKTYAVLPGGSQLGGKIIESENDAEQKKSENNCGQRCIAFLLVFDKYGWTGAKHI